MPLFDGECPFIEKCTKTRTKTDYNLWCIRVFKTCSTYDILAGIVEDERIMLPKKWKAEQNV